MNEFQQAFTMTKRSTMGFIFSTAFWGILIVLFGLSIIFREVFHINFPVFRLLFGLMIIYFGARVIAGGFMKQGKHSTIFGNANMQYSPGEYDYNIIFGNGNIDLSNYKLESGARKLEVSIVFGNGVVKLPPNIPAKVEVSAAFASAITPDKNMSALGKTTYTTPGFNESEPYLSIEADVVFGKMVIEKAGW